MIVKVEEIEKLSSGYNFRFSYQGKKQIITLSKNFLIQKGVDIKSFEEAARMYIKPIEGKEIGDITTQQFIDEIAVMV